MAANFRTTGKTTPDGAAGPQTFRSMIAVIVWWCWVLFAVGNLIDLAVEGWDHLSVVAAATLLMITGSAYVTAERPRIIAADEGITVRNPLRDHRIPWGLVSKVDVADLLRVHCRRPDKAKNKVISAWAVHYSRRRQMTSDLRVRRDRSRATPVRTLDSSPEAEAVRIARLLNDRATAADSEPGGGEPGEREPGGAGRLISTWSWQAVAALAGPALFLLIVALA